MKYTIKDMNATEFRQFLREKYACSASLRATKGKSLKQAWHTTKRGNWMVWFLCFSSGKKGYLTRPRYQKLSEVYCSPEFDAIYDYPARCAARAKAIREVIKVV